MHGTIWLVFTYAAIGIFLILMASRVLSIKRQPVHLRWELAPVPHDIGKVKYGGSYLEDFEWWKKPRQKSTIGPLVYMAREILLMRGVWKNNRSMWPLSISMHFGVYLFILVLVLYFANALLMITGASQSLPDILLDVTTIVLAAGCILGFVGTVGLILKRSLDDSLRNYSTFSTYFRLVFLLAVFASGGIALISAGNYAFDMSSFVKGIITADSNISVPAASAAHIIISYLFIIYLPFTNMAHFITKYFTYHAVRWNDTPQDKRIAGQLKNVTARPAGWSASHAAAGKTSEKEKP